MREITSGRCVRPLLTFLLCLMLLSSLAFGQLTTQGAIGGTVTDPEGRVINNAAVTVKNLGSNLASTVKTDSQGYFRVGQLEPATYSVSVKAEGFAPFRAEQVIVTVGSLTAVNPHLKIGATETVDVTAEAALINVTSAEFAPTLNELTIQDLPINGGRWSSFVMLTPAVVSDSNGFGLVSFRGMSTLLNNFTVDGADNNQAFFSEERGRTRAGYSTVKAAVQEFQVNTSNYSAEYGRSAGGVVNTVTKSGTIKLHGEAYWYDRDNNWGSFNPFTTLTSFNPTSQVSTTSPYKPEDVRKMGGFALGGPAKKDKLFWFVAYDRFHHNFPGTAVPNSAASFFAVPTAISATNWTSQYCGSVTAGTPNYNVCQMAAYLAKGATLAAGLSANSTPNSTAMKAVTQAQYAAAQTQWMNSMFGAGSTPGLYSITGSVPRTGDQDIFFPKVDWVIDQKNRLSIEANRMRWWSPAGIQTQGTNAYGVDSFGNDYVKDTWGVAKLDTILSDNLTNQVRVQIGRDFEFENNQQPSAYEQQTLLNGAGNPYGLPPNINVGAFQWGTPLFLNRVAYPDENRTQIADTISIMQGRHNLRFGIEFIHTNDKINNLYEQYAEYSFTGLPTYFAQLTDPAHKYFSTFYQAFQGTSTSTPVQTYSISTADWSFFAQDDVRLSRRLTVNAGVRFETELMPSPYSNLVNNITVGTQTVAAGGVPHTPDNWGPRLGFAWDTFGDGKTVLRGGYGIYFGRIINATLFSGMTATGAVNGQNAYSIKATNTVTPPPAFPDIITGNAPPPSSGLGVEYFDPHFKSPAIQEIDLTLQRQLPKNMVLSVSYLGSLGRHLPSFTDVNFAAPGTPYCATSSGLQTGSLAGGVCSAGTLLTPPSTVSYTLNNGTVTGLPISTLPSASATLPFYTSRLNYNYGGITDIFSGVNSNYNALAVQLEKRLSDHVQFAANYTWSHALDYGVNGSTTTTAGTDSMIDPLHPKFGMYGNSLYNVPNRFTFNMILEAPWQNKGLLKYAVDGWQVAPVVQIQNGLGNSVQLASAYPTVYVGTQEFQSVSSGLLGAGGSWQIPGTKRDGYLQPSTYVVDLRLSKDFPVYEQVKIGFSADAFNLFNHRNVTGVSTTSPYTLTNPSSGTAGTTSSPVLTTANTSNGASLFNVPSSANSNYVYGTRQIQLGLRLTF